MNRRAILLGVGTVAVIGSLFTALGVTSSAGPGDNLPVKLRVPQLAGDSAPLGCVPALISPVSGAVLDNGRNDLQDVIEWEFRWEPCPGATSYEIAIDGASTSVVGVEGPEFERFSPGNVITDVAPGLSWKVRARKGELMSGWSETRRQAIEPPDTDRLERRLAAGSGHTCMILQDRRLKCWGWNVYGELGDGTTTDRPGGVIVPGLADVVAVAAGPVHTCAIERGGKLSCWGQNQSGQAGTLPYGSILRPTEVAGLDDVIDVATGTAHTCALRNDGTVWCFGTNAQSQLGTGEAGQRPAPVQVPGLSNIVEVAATEASSCALASSGLAYCWGATFLTSGVYSPVPAEASGITGGRHLVANGGYACVLKAAGQIDCWGYGGNGQLQVESVYPALQVETGSSHTCAVEAGSLAVWCAGNNGNGQLGDGGSTGFQRPSTKALLPVPAYSVAAGSGHTCALERKEQALTAWCWGYNGHGGLGDGTTVNRFVPVWASVSAPSTATPYPQPTTSPTSGATATRTPTRTPTPAASPISLSLKLLSSSQPDTNQLSGHEVSITNTGTTAIDTFYLVVQGWYSADASRGGSDDCAGGGFRLDAYLPPSGRMIQPGQTVTVHTSTFVGPDPQYWPQCVSRASGYVIVEVHTQSPGNPYGSHSWTVAYAVTRHP